MSARCIPVPGAAGAADSAIRTCSCSSEQRLPAAASRRADSRGYGGGEKLQRTPKSQSPNRGEIWKLGFGAWNLGFGALQMLEQSSSPLSQDS